MPRPNYGNAVKQRATQFFTVLIDYANDELDIEERQLENLQRDIQLNWQTDKRCVIRTKIRYLENLIRLSGKELTGEQIKESIKCLTDFIEIIEDNRASKGGSETWHFTLNLWYNRFDRAANIDRFDTEWDRRKSPQNAANIDRDTSRADDWLELVRSTLVTQQYQRITTNQLMVEDRIKFSLEEVYVPLGLMKRPAQTILEVRDLIDDSDEDNGVKIIPDPDCLLEQLVTNLAPNRIGIIGEPGSGKTTCLQKLAAGLLDRQLLPIWISLADLQGETLENYLLQDWLKLATRKIAIELQLQQDLALQFERGRVWLLLDAVDEMTSDASISLGNLDRQLQGWVGNAHIILTCRSNVWDSGKNALENFTTYHNLSLSYGYSQPHVGVGVSLPLGDSLPLGTASLFAQRPVGVASRREGKENRVRQFIQGWFKDRPHLSEHLIAELTQPQYQRLRDAIKNPLRLALLCRYWMRTQGKLPSTKASLYQQFTDTIYDWKQDRFPTSLAQRQQLNDALSKLAFNAIDLAPLVDQSRERFRFRLHHHTVLEFLTPDLLELALQLGWLNQTGISIATGAKIYAFYHSTFQEYFAARSIADWQYFFDGDLHRHAPIFSSSWHETILFWFGRSDVFISDKEACLQALLNFDREHGGFYAYRAYFLAAAVLAEFPESIYSQTIIDRLLTWRFAEFVPTQNLWQFYPLPIQDGARSALRQTDRIAAISGLEKFVQSVENPFLRWQAAHSLGKVFDPGNPIAIQSLVDSLATVSSGDICIKICESLCRIDPEYNRVAIDTLVNIIQTKPTVALTRKAAFTLGKLSIERITDSDRDRALFRLAIDALVEIIESDLNLPVERSSHRSNRIAALENLRQIEPAHPATQQQFINNQTLPTSTRNRRKKAAHQPRIDIAIAELERKLSIVENAETQRRYAYQLGKFQTGHPLAVQTLLQLMCSTQASSFYKRTGEYLKEVLSDEQLPSVISKLKDRAGEIERGDRSNSALECYKLLWYCADRLPYQKFTQIWNQ
jgi:HEAT repeat protein